MPGLDGTGPRGEGPLTGGGRGLCMSSKPGRPRRDGSGRGTRANAGRGSRRTRGRGCRYIVENFIM